VHPPTFNSCTSLLATTKPRNACTNRQGVEYCKGSLTSGLLVEMLPHATEERVAARVRRWQFPDIDTVKDLGNEEHITVWGWYIPMFGHICRPIAGPMPPKCLFKFHSPKSRTHSGTGRCFAIRFLNNHLLLDFSLTETSFLNLHCRGSVELLSQGCQLSLSPWTGIMALALQRSLVLILISVLLSTLNITTVFAQTEMYVLPEMTSQLSKGS
jgi:hypothetical protein